MKGDKSIPNYKSMTPPNDPTMTHQINFSVPPRRINEIVHGKRSVSADTALRLSRYFGLSERFWLNLQARYDLEVEKDKLELRLQKEVRVLTLKSA